MKLIPLVSFAIASSAALAGTAGPFPPQTIPASPLSLLDSARQSLRDATDAPISPTPAMHRAAPRAKFFSAMPVITPRNIDPKFVRRPDASVDYKMIVISPDVDSPTPRRR